MGQKILKRALRAFAMYNKEVGYTQSINYVVGFFLILNGADDEDAFWLFLAISKQNQKYGRVKNFEGGFEGFYQDQFPLYHQFVYIFTELFEERYPELKAHLDEVGMMPAVWLQKWFMTLFLYSFPMNICIRVWDNLLVEGISFMFKFPLAIMDLFQKDLLESDLEGINNLFESWNEGEIEYEPETIIQKARNMKVSSEDVTELKRAYKKEMEGDKRIILRIPIIEESMVDNQFFRRPSQGIRQVQKPAVENIIAEVAKPMEEKLDSPREESKEAGSGSREDLPTQIQEKPESTDSSAQKDSSPQQEEERGSSSIQAR